MTQTASSQPPLMGYVPDGGRMARRQRAAQLLEAVFEERVEPRIAINRWPEAMQEQDASMDCAYQALWHFEADEEKQKTELFYMDAQLELLRQMAQCFESGQDLPTHILKLYRHASAARFFYSRSLWEDSRHKVRQVGQAIVHIWRQALDVCFEPAHKTN